MLIHMGLKSQISASEIEGYRKTAQPSGPSVNKSSVVHILNCSRIYKTDI